MDKFDAMNPERRIAALEDEVAEIIHDIIHVVAMIDYLDYDVDRSTFTSDEDEQWAKTRKLYKTRFSELNSKQHEIEDEIQKIKKDDKTSEEMYATYEYWEVRGFTIR